MSKGEAKWVRGSFDAERLPVDVKFMMDEAVNKVARVFGIDLVTKPKRKVICFEHIAMIIDTMPEESMRLLVEAGTENRSNRPLGGNNGHHKEPS